MGSLSVWHWLIFLAIVLIFFGGKGKISELMGDFAKGIKSFKQGMKDDETAQKPADPNPAQATPKVIEGTAVQAQPAGSAPGAAATAGVGGTASPAQPGKVG